MMIYHALRITHPSAGNDATKDMLWFLLILKNVVGYKTYQECIYNEIINKITKFDEIRWSQTFSFQFNFTWRTK